MPRSERRLWVAQRLETLAFLKSGGIPQDSPGEILESLARQLSQSGSRTRDFWLAQLALTGLYPSQEGGEPMISNALGRVNLKKLKRLFSRYSHSQILFKEVEKVLDISQFSKTRQVSGIPRVVHTLAEAAQPLGYTLAVWDRGALAPVQLSSEGRVLFPKTYWRRDPNPSVFERFYFWLVERSWGRQLLFPLELIRLPEALKRFVSLFRNSKPRTRARVNLLLRDSELFLAEIPDKRHSDCIAQAQVYFPNLRTRILVHDLLPISHPQFFDDNSKVNFSFFIRLFERTREIIVGSYILRDQVLGLSEALYRKPLKTRVAPLPVRGASVPSISKASADYFLVVGGFGPRKGLADLACTLEKFGPLMTQIEVLGNPNPTVKREMSLARRLVEIPGVKLLGHTNDETMFSKIRGSVAVVYLSIAEGYGLPILESLAQGTPVICADTPINRFFAETYGGLVLVPLIGGELDLQSLEEILKNPERLRAIRSNIFSSTIPTNYVGWAQEALSSVSDSKDVE